MVELRRRCSCFCHGRLRLSLSWLNYHKLPSNIHQCKLVVCFDTSCNSGVHQLQCSFSDLIKCKFAQTGLEKCGFVQNACLSLLLKKLPKFTKILLKCRQNFAQNIIYVSLPILLKKMPTLRSLSDKCIFAGNPSNL